MRGGEWVLDRLARLFGPTSLYTLVDDRRPMTDAIRACRVTTSPLQQMPGAAGRLRRWYLPLMPWAVSQLRVRPCELLISTSSAVMKSIHPPRGVPHLCYCHSPARYIWEQTSDYARGAMGALRIAGLRAVRRQFQKWDRATAARVTKFLANSRHTAARIRRCYGREAEVVYPPVRTELFTIDPGVGREDWYLFVGALEPYKRADLVVAAAERAKLLLKIAGGGSQLDALRMVAGPTVTLLGRVSDQALLDLYRRAKALIFPQIEDFGIIAAEAQSAGCPVIALACGGAAEIVGPDTGVLFESQSVDGLLGAVEAFEAKSFDSAACRSNALRFREEVFDQSMTQHALSLLAGR
jgi:glycosyltransferase involved in cell wall biosynthesis